MNAFDTLEQQLRRSARRRYGRRRRRWRPASAIVAAAAIVMLLVMAAREDRPRFPAPADEREAVATSPQPRTWTPVVGDDDRGHPTIARDSVPPEQAEALAVLRRPQSDADRIARAKVRVRGGRTINAAVRDNFYDLRRRSGSEQLAAIAPVRRSTRAAERFARASHAPRVDLAAGKNPDRRARIRAPSTPGIWSVGGRFIRSAALRMAIVS